MEDSFNVKLKVKVTCRKYPARAKAEDIEQGKVQPYAVEEKEVIVDAND